LQYLQDKGLEVEIIEYLKNPLSIVELSDIFAKLDRKPSEMIRKQEAIFKADFKGKNFTEDEWIRIIAENPKLLNRPIIVRGNKAVWGDPVENIEGVL
jgi:arsenate reductase (glutaredoxin)